MSECPLCKIPERETPLYEDNSLFLVETKERKGHQIRVMVCIKLHVENPTFQERTKAYAILIDHMKQVMGDGKWYIIDSTYASVPTHFHIIGCDSFGTPEELELLAKTPKVEFPLVSYKVEIHENERT